MSAWTCRQFAVKAAEKIVPPHPRIPCWKGLSADSEEKREPVSGINAGVVVSLKVLDPKRPIREGNRRAGAAVGRDHAPHVGRRHRVPLDPGRRSRMKAYRIKCDRRKLELHQVVAVSYTHLTLP